MAISTELIAVLPEAANATQHVQLRAGLDTLLGETHLVVVDGRLFVASRGSLLTPLERLVNVHGVRLEAGNFREVLRLEHSGGSATVTLSFGDADAVKELLLTLGEDASHDDAVEEPSEPPSAATPSLEPLEGALSEREAVVSAVSVRDRARELEPWEARVALAQEHERGGRLAEALALLDAATKAGGPPEAVVPATVRVARALGDVRRLTNALRRSKKLSGDGAERRAIDREIRALVTGLVYDGPDAAGPTRPRKPKRRAPRSAAMAAPHHAADPRVNVDEEAEDAAPAQPALEIADAPAQLRPPEPEPPKKNGEPPSALLSWLLLITLVTVGAASALMRLLD